MDTLTLAWVQGVYCALTTNPTYKYLYILSHTGSQAETKVSYYMVTRKLIANALEESFRGWDFETICSIVSELLCCSYFTESPKVWLP